MSVTVPSDQPLVPVITGGDLGAYSLAREFHEQAGLISAVVPTSVNRNFTGTRIAQLFPVGPMLEPKKVLADLSRVADVLEGHRRPLLLMPGYDHLVRIVLDHREELTELGYRIPELTVDQLDRGALKDRFYALCEQLGVRYPRTTTVDCGPELADSNDADARSAIAAQIDTAGLSWPVVVKADDGGAWADVRFEGRRKVHLAHSHDDVARLARRASGAGYRAGLIVQDYVAGADSQLRILHLFRSRTGGIRSAGLGEVIIEDHAPGLEGNARAIVVPAEVTEQERQITSQGTALLEALDWHGFAMFDLKVDADTGEPVFLEMNPRLGRHHFYLTASGINPVVDLLAEFGGDDTAAPSQSPSAPRQPHQRPAASLTIPQALAHRYANESQRRTLTEAKRLGTVQDPWDYPADRHWQRRLYHWVQRRRSAADLEASR
ncbi:hypothetical protein [Citricoccus muralis]|uniref:ATP-grasp domain-containing protein n=1 Tax=Citricoccus muralis TaxID=169134 RepID=A0ABY8H403_9MICC|nr:hypothetical protein [Citricoccus muralis]WFP15859.1 hypothetical protein P8192_10695 [Citricoccus muralis]